MVSPPHRGMSAAVLNAIKRATWDYRWHRRLTVGAFRALSEADIRALRGVGRLRASLMLTIQRTWTDDELIQWLGLWPDRAVLPAWGECNWVGEGIPAGGVRCSGGCWCGGSAIGRVQRRRK